MAGSKRVVRSFPRAKGSAGAIDETWKEAVRAAIAKQDMTPSSYADKIGIARNTLFMALSEKQHGTRYKRQIMEGLGMVYRDVDEPDFNPDTDDVCDRINELTRDLSLEDQQMVLAFVERLTKPLADH